MDRGECWAVYVDDRVKIERWIYKNPKSGSGGVHPPLSSVPEESTGLHDNIQLFLQVFNKGM